MILQRIIEQTEKRVAEEKAQFSIPDLLKRIEDRPSSFEFESRLKAEGVHVIAEIKRRSPSNGVMNLLTDPVTIAGEYLREGAFALSVLTEPQFFGGDIEYLSQIRTAFPDSLLLMKDFLVDEYQLLRGKAAGADAVLLIVSVLTPTRLGAMLSRARELGLTALVEVHNEAELAVAVGEGATLIGVNNRNLDTLTIDLEVSRRLIKSAPPGTTLISESGIEKGKDIQALARLGYRGFLIGSALMKDSSPGQKLKALLKEARCA